MIAKCLTVLIFLLTQLTINAGELDKHLQLYAGFNNDTKPTALSDNAGDGIKEVKGKFEYVPGRFGKALYFGNASKNKSELVYNAGMTFEGNEWTIAFWVKMDDAEQKKRGTLFRTFTTGAWKDGDIFAVFDKWQKLDFSRFDSGKQCCSTSVTAKVVPAGKWTHLAFTSKEGKQQIYVNGIELKYTRQKDVDKTGTVQKYIRIGNSSFGEKHENYIKGAIDELKLYDKALNEKELKKCMTRIPA
jgi:concanavalin A-like lectin/glucanase superfamily protein